MKAFGSLHTCPGPKASGRLHKPKELPSEGREGGLTPPGCLSLPLGPSVMCFPVPVSVSHPHRVYLLMPSIPRPTHCPVQPVRPWEST